MKKALSYLYREILLKVNEELNRLYDSEYDDDQEYKEPIEEFRVKYKALKLEDVDNFDEKKLEELYIESSDNWIGDNEIVYEVVYEFRTNGTPIDTLVDEGRWFCSREVATKITGLNNLSEDGTSVYLGWTYYFGGGKHSQPEQVEWMEDCYLLTCKEVEETKIVKVYLLSVDDNEKVEDK